jgi:hypothetical protein
MPTLSTDSDIELGRARDESLDFKLGRVRDGYPALARWIAQDPDNEPFVFRKFSRLSARHILHLQARLFTLEHEIDQLDEAAKTSSDPVARQASRRYETLIEHKDNESRKEKERVEKLEELGGLLKEYYKSLLRQAQISQFQKPSARVLSTFRDYLEGTGFKAEGMDGMPLISGRAGRFLSEEFEGDLIALRAAAEEDVLSKFLQDHWAFQKRQSTDPIDRTTLYKNSHVVRTVSAVSMIIAAVLLISAILSLHVVTKEKFKLGLVAMYTLLFALSVSLLTNARRAEVFAATAAYAAVLVVFVSGELGGSRHQCLIQLENGYFRSVRCPEK